LSRHISRGQIAKVQAVLTQKLQALWRSTEEEPATSESTQGKRKRQGIASRSKPQRKGGQNESE
jgi:hypothetical protein